jgi:hypothetical protein
MHYRYTFSSILIHGQMKEIHKKKKKKKGLNLTFIIRKTPCLCFDLDYHSHALKQHKLNKGQTDS